MEAPVRPRARLAHVQGIPIGLRFEPGPLGLVYPVSKHGVLPYELSLGGNLLNLLAEMKRKDRTVVSTLCLSLIVPQ